MKNLHRLGLLIVLFGACQGGSPTEPVGSMRVLFVGNSLTYFNDLPATVRALAASGSDTIVVGSATAGGVALIDHINGATDAVQQIRGGTWDFVVLQQGPTTTGGICLDSMLLWTQMFDTIIRGTGATPALFMVWPIGGSMAGFDAVHASYQLAAQTINGIFLPAGEGWRAAWAVDPTLQLYGPDGFHPSAMGSFVAALVIYERLSGRDVRTLPALAFNGGQLMAMPAPTVRLLQEAAHQANAAAAAAPAAAAPTRRAAAATRC